MLFLKLLEFKWYSVMVDWTPKELSCKAAISYETLRNNFGIYESCLTTCRASGFVFVLLVSCITIAEANDNCSFGIRT